MIFYHGSKLIINEPKVRGSSVDNDYGPAFYLTLDKHQAKLWACKNEQIGYTNKYYIRNDVFNGLKVLDLTNKDQYSVLNWLAILMHFRNIDERYRALYKNRLEWLEKNYYIDVNGYDVIKGFRADDSYFKFPLKFLSDLLSYEDLIEVFKLGNLEIQYAFISEKSIKALKFLDVTLCDESFVGKYKSIILESTKQFNEIINRPIDDSKTYLGGIIKNDDK